LLKPGGWPSEQTYLRDGLDLPVCRSVLQLRPEAWYVDSGVGRQVLAGFDKKNLDIRVLCKSGREEKTSGAASDDDEVEL